MKADTSATWLVPPMVISAQLLTQFVSDVSITTLTTARANAFFASIGVTVTGVMTDDGHEITTSVQPQEMVERIQQSAYRKGRKNKGTELLLGASDYPTSPPILTTRVRVRTMWYPR